MDQDGICNLFSSISYKNSVTGAQLGVSLEKGRNLKRNQTVVEPLLLVSVEGWWLVQISEMTSRRIGGVGFTLLDMESFGRGLLCGLEAQRVGITKTFSSRACCSSMKWATEVLSRGWVSLSYCRKDELRIVRQFLGAGRFILHVPCGKETSDLVILW